MDQVMHVWRGLETSAKIVDKIKLFREKKEKESVHITEYIQLQSCPPNDFMPSDISFKEVRF